MAEFTVIQRSICVIVWCPSGNALNYYNLMKEKLFCSISMKVWIDFYFCGCECPQQRCIHMLTAKSWIFHTFAICQTAKKISHRYFHTRRENSRKCDNRLILMNSWILNSENYKLRCVFYYGKLTNLYYKYCSYL